MNLKRLLRKIQYILDKIFRKNKYTNLINLRDIVPEFKRENFTDTRKIDEYKKEYVNNLNQNKTILLNDLTDDKIKSKMEMYIDLFMLNCPEEVNVTPKSVFEEEAKNRIISLKLKTYLKEVEDLIIDIKYRLVAVGEILRDGISIYEKTGRSKNKIVVLKSLLNILESNLICTENQARALKMSLKTYEDKSEFAYSLIDKDEFSNPEKIIDGHLSLRWKAVSKDLRVVPSLDDAITNSNCDVLSKIVLGEIILEKYVYQNRSQIDIYRDEVNSLEQNLNKIMKEAYRDDLSKSEREKTLEINLIDFTNEGILEEIEKKYLLFQKYSRNIVNQSDLEQLYKVNFWLMFYDVDYPNYLWFNSKFKSPLERDVYKNIVSDIINAVITDKNGFILCEFGMHTADAIKWIDKYLKDGEKNYSVYDNILRNSEKMKFLLYVYFGLGIKQFFENEFYANNLELALLGNSLFSIENFIHTISLISYFKALHWVQLINKEIECDKNLIYFRKMFDLLEQIESDAGIYSLPDCITNIRYNYTHEKESELIIDDINKNAVNKKVIFPNSLKRVDVKPGLLNNVNIAGIYLNDGLEEISGGSFESVKLEHLSIPASLRSLSIRSFDYKSIRTLEFRDYTKSTFKGDYKTLRKIFRQFILQEKFFLNNVDDVIQEDIYKNRGKLVSMNSKYKFIRSLSNSTNLEALVFMDEELDEPIIIEISELKSIKIVYNNRINPSNNEVEYYPVMSMDDTTNIIKAIEEKVKIKRKKMLGRSLRK